jgi:hypothetical protein
MARTFQDMVGESLLMVFSEMKEWEIDVLLRGKTVTHDCKCIMQDSDGYQNFAQHVFYVFVDDVLAGETLSRSHPEHVRIAKDRIRSIYGMRGE